jgi:transcriptional regulator with XRE-family HTH domain
MLGLSQSGLANELGWSVKQVSNLETGARPVQQQTELAIECLLRRAGKWQEFNESN